MKMHIQVLDYYADSDHVWFRCYVDDELIHGEGQLLVMKREGFSELINRLSPESLCAENQASIALIKREVAATRMRVPSPSILVGKTGWKVFDEREHNEKEKA